MFFHQTTRIRTQNGKYFRKNHSISPLTFTYAHRAQTSRRVKLRLERYNRADGSDRPVEFNRPGGGGGIASQLAPPEPRRSHLGAVQPPLPVQPREPPYLAALVTAQVATATLAPPTALPRAVTSASLTRRTCPSPSTPGAPLPQNAWRRPAGPPSGRPSHRPLPGVGPALRCDAACAPACLAPG